MHFKISILAGVCSVLLLGCSLSANGGGGGGANTNHRLYGSVRDTYSGQPVAGVSVMFADYSATTGADGSYSVEFSANSGRETGTLQLHKTGFNGLYCEGCSADRAGTFAPTSA